MTISLERRTRRLLFAGAVALAITIVPMNAIPQPPSRISSSPCINGVIPGNPYVVNCNLPRRGRPAIGAAPDAGAIIACRNIPGCLSYYVNYPGSISPASPVFGN
jgi:hypothetical protein